MLRLHVTLICKVSHSILQLQNKNEVRLVAATKFTECQTGLISRSGSSGGVQTWSPCADSGKMAYADTLVTMTRRVLMSVRATSVKTGRCTTSCQVAVARSRRHPHFCRYVRRRSGNTWSRPQRLGVCSGRRAGRRRSQRCRRTQRLQQSQWCRSISQSGGGARRHVRLRRCPRQRAAYIKATAMQ